MNSVFNNEVNALYCIIYYTIIVVVSLFFGDRFYKNNSIVKLTDIGEGSQALFCISNYSYSAGDNEFDRDWYFPNGSVVQQRNYYQPYAADFYRNKDRSVVRLNRRNNALMPTGIFCCHINITTGASRSTQSVCMGVYPPNDSGTIYIC